MPEWRSRSCSTRSCNRLDSAIGKWQLPEKKTEKKTSGILRQEEGAVTAFTVPIERAGKIPTR